jgi:uncharacterized protein YmfQ (DUF2313 family)
VIRQDYLDQLGALLPTGPALPRHPDSALMRLLSMPAAELAAVDARAAALLAEADPRITSELLPDWETDFGLPDDCSPLESFSRASPATWFDGSGTLQVAGIDQPRPEVDPVSGALTGRTIVEPASQNLVVNPRAEGAVVGTPGTAPSLWRVTSAWNGLSRSIVGAGLDAGLPYIDVRLWGTAAANGGNAFWFDINNSSPASAGMTLTQSVYLRLMAGSLAGLNVMQLRIEGTNGSSRTELLGLTPLRDQISGQRQRFAYTGTLANAATTHSAGLIEFTVTAGAVVDFTLRIGAPQREPGAAPTSLILPPVGAPAIASRAADILITATAAERRAALLARMLGAPGQSRAYFIGLAATLGYPGATVEEFRMPRAGLAAAGDACHGYDWSQAWRLRVAAAASRFARAGEAAAGDPLTTFGDGRLECAVRRAAPAHTLPLIAYGA